ncbi:MAG: response regulator [Tepidisphaeraceae bacterium]
MAVVLIVDDHREVRETMSALVREEGHEALTADGVRRTRQLLAACHIDLILLDVHMPEIDGLTLLRELRRSQPRAGEKRIPVVICSASDVHRPAAMADGADAYVLKSDFESLYDALQKYAPKAHSVPIRGWVERDGRQG